MTRRPSARNTSGSQRVAPPSKVTPAPLARGVTVRSNPPVIRGNGKTVTITHREALYTILATGLANENVYPVGVINPFNPYVFPWLAGIASSYDKYKFHDIVLEFVPLVSSTTAGQVTLAWDPAGSDSTVGYNELSLMHSVANPPWMPMQLRLPGSSEKYVGEQADSGGATSDFYNHGRIYAGVIGMAAAKAGQIYINYVVTLSAPQPTTSLASVFSLSGVTTGTPATVSATVDGFSVVTSGTNILLPLGSWKVEFFIQGTGLSSLGISSFGGAVVKATRQQGTGTEYVGYTIARSDGGPTSGLTLAPTYTTITLFQARMVRVDANTYTSSGIFV